MFALDVINNGPQVAPQVVISDSLAAGLTFVSAEVVGEGPCQLTRPEDVNVVTCEVGDLAVGETARALVTVNPSADLRRITNAGTVGSGALDKLTDLTSTDERNFDEITIELLGDPVPTTPTPTPTPATPTTGPTSSPSPSPSPSPSSTATVPLDRYPGNGSDDDPSSDPTRPGSLPSTGAIVSVWLIVVGILAAATGVTVLILNRRRPGRRAAPLTQ